MMSKPRIHHWSQDSYWADALDEYYVRRDSKDSVIAIDLKAVEEAAFHGDGPAYKLLDAMRSVWEQETSDGCRGAPRVMLALLIQLTKIKSPQN